MAAIQTKPMSNLQAELLKLYANNLSDEQLLEIKEMLGNYFAQKATEAMDEVWEAQDLTEQDMTNWTNEHNRLKGSH
ncbi:hypothetical protein [Runella salmonicolor]|jgi:hypothetical protein|uniref:Dephospho-CoA kinase n=1 Tax=Runella salmonicolor TaxID=2950278 RepID=A0ABT1FM13_9BACT|nr:hypothetical protein [Runella salmonicolor]MCP1381823.1 hypothetical protein [Runella salmonicolor]